MRFALRASPSPEKRTPSSNKSFWVASSSQTKIDSALGRLKNDIVAAGSTVEGGLSGEVVDAKDSASVKALLERVGEIDHLVWTSGDALRTTFSTVDLDANKGL